MISKFSQDHNNAQEHFPKVFKVSVPISVLELVWIHVFEILWIHKIYYMIINKYKKERKDA